MISWRLALSWSMRSERFGTADMCAAFSRAACSWIWRRHRLQERHHGAQAWTKDFDRVLALAATLRLKIGATLFVLFDPGFGKAAVANFGQHFPHFLPGLLGDDSRAARVIAVLGRVADGIAHVAQPAAVDQIDDQLQFVHALEIGDFGLIASLDERVEARLDESADAATEDGLLAEQVGLGLFGEGGFDDAGASAANAAGVRKRKLPGFAGGILLDGQQARRAAAFNEDFADAVARGLRRDHGDIHGGRGLDRAEADVEAVGEHQHFARREMRLDGLAVEGSLLGIGHEDHDDIGPGCSLGRRHNGEAVVFGLGPRVALFRQAHAHVDATVAKIERMGVPLRAVTDDGDFLSLNQRQIGRIVVMKLGHFSPFADRSAAADEVRVARCCLVPGRASHPNVAALSTDYPALDPTASRCGDSFAAGGRSKSEPRVIATLPVRAISSTPKGRSTSSNPSILSTVPDTSRMSDSGETSTTRARKTLISSIKCGRDCWSAATLMSARSRTTAARPEIFSARSTSTSFSRLASTRCAPC